jgi:hypothetical protein
MTSTAVAFSDGAYVPAENDIPRSACCLGLVQDPIAAAKRSIG